MPITSILGLLHSVVYFHTVIVTTTETGLLVIKMGLTVCNGFRLTYNTGFSAKIRVGRSLSMALHDLRPWAGAQQVLLTLATTGHLHLHLPRKLGVLRSGL